MFKSKVYIFAVFLFTTGVFINNSAFPSKGKVLNVLTSYAYISDLVSIIGKDKVNADFMAKGSNDPHHIIAKPSFIAKARSADLLIINGAQLEIGWITPIIRESNNPDILPGKNGFLDLSVLIKKIEIPANVSRDNGDVHPDGNPHFYLDPYHYKYFAQAITKKLCSLDADHCAFYQSNLVIFLDSWEIKLKEWALSLAKLKGVKVIQYHKLHQYFFERFGIITEAEMEALPGMPPTARHIEEVIRLVKTQGIKLLIIGVYQPVKVAEKISRETGAKVIILPSDVGSMSEAKNIFALFDEMVKRLTQ